MFIDNKNLWHFVNYSPWPICVSLITGVLPFTLVSFFIGGTGNLYWFFFGFIALFCVTLFWFFDINTESAREGYHLDSIQLLVRRSMALFIFSEVMFFFGFFWSFFWASFYPTLDIEVTWPSEALYDLVLDPLALPFINTIILLLSGFTLTLAHLLINYGNIKLALNFCFITLFLALSFIFVQGFEYFSGSFDISDSVYGTEFYVCTGFHGFHVIIGAIFIFIITLRIMKNQFSRSHHFGFEASAWYWHVGDVVWLYLFVMIYFLGDDLIEQLVI